MAIRSIRVELDSFSDAHYLGLSDQPVSETCEFNEEGTILVDLDVNGEVVGIEILGANTEIPLTDLAHRFHIRPERAAEINMLLPSIGYSMKFHSAPDTVTSQRPVTQLQLSR